MRKLINYWFISLLHKLCFWDFGYSF